jgi:hypothetical protein
MEFRGGRRNPCPSGKNDKEGFTQEVGSELDLKEGQRIDQR